MRTIFPKGVPYLFVWLALFTLPSQAGESKDSAENMAKIEERLTRIEQRLERITQILERTAQGFGPDYEKVMGDKKLVMAIQAVEKKYGITDIAQKLSGRTKEIGQRGYLVVHQLHKKILKMLYEEDEKTKPDVNLLEILRAGFRLRGEDLARGSQIYRSGIFLDPASGRRGYHSQTKKDPSEKLYGPLGEALAKELVRALDLPALSRYAAAEAQFFPKKLVEPALAAKRKALPPGPSAQRRRLTAAHAACGDVQALEAITKEIRAARNHPDWMEKIGHDYGTVGQAFGLLALAKSAEKELKDAQASSKKGRYYPRQSSRTMLNLIGRGTEINTKYQELINDMDDEEKKDQNLIQERYREIMIGVLEDGTQWIYRKFRNLVWDKDARVFVAK